MKQLLAFLFLITIVSCAPVKEKIEDRTGGCLNGKCTTKPGTSNKPDECSSPFKITSFRNSTFETKEEKNTSGIKFKARLEFGNSNASFTQFCEKSSTEYASPTIISGFATSMSGDRLRFTEPQIKVEKFGTQECKAEIAKDNFAVSFEGSCLVLTDSSREVFYFKKVKNN